MLKKFYSKTFLIVILSLICGVLMNPIGSNEDNSKHKLITSINDSNKNSQLLSSALVETLLGNDLSRLNLKKGNDDLNLFDQDFSDEEISSLLNQDVNGEDEDNEDGISEVDTDRYMIKKAAPRRIFIGKRSSYDNLNDYLNSLDKKSIKRNLGNRQKFYDIYGKRNGQIHRIFIGKRGDIKRIFIG